MIYVIVWEGRDQESGVWDTYPCLYFGYYEDETAAKKMADKLNLEEPGDYDYHADEVSSYKVSKVRKADCLTDGGK